MFFSVSPGWKCIALSSVFWESTLYSVQHCLSSIERLESRLGRTTLPEYANDNLNTLWSTVYTDVCEVFLKKLTGWQLICSAQHLDLTCGMTTVSRDDFEVSFLPGQSFWTTNPHLGAWVGRWCETRGCTSWLPSCSPSTRAYCDGSRYQHLQWISRWRRTLLTHLPTRGSTSQLFDILGRCHVWRLRETCDLGFCLLNYLIGPIVLQQEDNYQWIGGTISHFTTSRPTVFRICAFRTE